MVRGNGSARAETSVKADTRLNTIRIPMRRGPLRDQPTPYKGPVDETPALGTPTPATALPPTAARTTSVSRDSLPEPGACPEGRPPPQDATEHSSIVRRPRRPRNRLCEFNSVAAAGA